MRSPGRNPAFVQTEHTRGEGVCYYVENLTSSQDKIAKSHNIETAFFGRGGKSKAGAALKQILAIEKAESADV